MTKLCTTKVKANSHTQKKTRIVRIHHLILSHKVGPQLFVEPFKSPSVDPWQPLVEASLLVAKGWDVLDQKILSLTLPPSPSIPIPLPTHPQIAANTSHKHALTTQHKKYYCSSQI